ncbi:phosphopantetheinyl transferase [Salipiger aestuarii]|uniref:Enterobactin synthase component D n=1 Tax=Salipiger aestuarii TaxID=568098 RepID=A0A327YGC1_9RHOB|nr:4'-phosphopantetheinyl transferase superfamily protein [Salipiger aestuarii]EIE51494.1 phosphopantetheinyl transferase PptA, putative [Citreicella sp. 357]KAA8608176.1 phosphopantetheinyl transferase [Salipiger aestuarii]KAA8612239.1 phosphopantetheinyl transferase [Salipiger aestuarii]KAB2541367.1 phosphopantetheinyl transferase [Salipiger aestuarii]RAK20020.1 4'-phosphopantetheinyl transferase superfamily protein [Salipiger aestuarii]
MTPKALSRALADTGLLQGLGWSVSLPVDDPDALFDSERAALRRAVPARLAEFTGGRVAARAAMARIGIGAQAIPMQDDRAPLWPQGVAGSISHGGGLCLAVAARGPWRGIGIDLEPDADMDAALIDAIATPAELTGLAPLPPERAAMRVFSAKEAAYKAQYPLCRALFGFDAMHAGLPLFDMRMTRDIGLGIGARIPVRQEIIAGLIVSLSLLP